MTMSTKLRFTFESGLSTVRLDDVCWAVQKRRGKGGEGDGSGRHDYQSLSFHGTLEDSLTEVIRRLAESKGAETLTEHVENIRAIWADVKQAVRAELRRATR